MGYHDARGEGSYTYCNFWVFYPAVEYDLLSLKF